MTTDGLTERITRLERENRRLKRYGGAVLVLVVAFVVMGQAAPAKAPGELRAKSLEIVDKDGKTRMALVVGPDGSPMLIMADGADRKRLMLTADESRDIAYVALLDTKEAVRAMMVAPGQKNPTIAVLGTDQKPRMAMTVKNNMPALGVFDAKGKVFGRLFREASGGAALELHDAEGEIIFRAPSR